MTQCDRILRHLQDYGCMRLGARIHDLKAMGYDIRTTSETARNRYGEKTHYARYTLI